MGEPALESREGDRIPAMGSFHRDTGSLDPGEKDRKKDKQKEAFIHVAQGRLSRRFYTSGIFHLKKITTLLPKTARLTCVRPDR